MAKKVPYTLPLQERIPKPRNLHRASQLLILALLFSFLFYRLSSLQTHVHLNYDLSLLAFFCETWFSFVWIITMILEWNPIEYKTYPQRLLKRVESDLELPSVDMFVTTTDHLLEPPIITVNTVLSLLAIDYPANKLACYISDDGGSVVTFYSLVEASKFAQMWVPFCRKYEVEVRAPFMYFSDTEKAVHGSTPDFIKEWRKMKTEYEALRQRITHAIQNPNLSEFMGDMFAAFSNIERGNHPSIVKIIMENKENKADGVPHLIYVSREKRPKHHHRYKAGAMNVLIRVSGVMTNAPFMLNVDCDMFANNPMVAYHAMCLFLGSSTEKDGAYVQFPQMFYGVLKDDPFGNQMKVLSAHLGHGMAGLQGPGYAGTGCFHRRKIIYGSLPENKSYLRSESFKELERRFGPSREFIDSAIRILSEDYVADSRGLSRTLEAAKQVASCIYELNTCWGNEVGLVYGSTAEDVLTGLKIQAMGWRSLYCTPDPPAFLGCAPTSGPDSMTQQKRWATGLLEVLLQKKGPLLATLTKELELKQCFAYLTVNIWSLRSIPEYCYSLLPAFCLLTSTNFLPKISEPAFIYPAALFFFFHIHTLGEYLNFGLSVREWWNNIRMVRIISATAWLFSLLSVLLKLLGISDTVFELTRKDDTPKETDDKKVGRFTFDSSPLFISGTVLLFLNMAALLVGLMKLLFVNDGWSMVGIGELICSAWLVFSFMPFLRGLFGKGSYGIPWSIICKSMVVTVLLLHSFSGVSRA